MSLLSEYERRTSWKYESIRGAFCTHEGLGRKVNADGSYAPFHGSTVVFRAGPTCVRSIGLMQKVLSYRLGGAGLTAADLPSDTIHMTLHDLISPEQCASDTPDAYDREVADSIVRASGIVEGIREEYAGRKIVMVPDRIVNMVSKSLVLLLRPQTEQDYELLLEMYHRFDSIRNLPYVLTPHITLYYYKPGMLDGDRLGAAVDYAQISPEERMGFDFFPEGLTAQSFLDMQTYMDVPMRICFCCDGGLNRSVLAANILTHLAKKRNIPVIGYARAAFSNTQGQPVPQQVWETLEKHGIQPDKSYAFGRYLEHDEASHYSAFAAITGGAMSRFGQMHLTEESVHRISSFFFGIRDPEYGEITHEQAFTELYGRTEKFLDAFEADYRKHIRK